MPDPRRKRNRGVNDSNEDDGNEDDGDEDELCPPASTPIESIGEREPRLTTLSVKTLYPWHSGVRKERKMDSKTKTAVIET